MYQKKEVTYFLGEVLYSIDLCFFLSATMVSVISLKSVLYNFILFLISNFTTCPEYLNSL